MILINILDCNKLNVNVPTEPVMKFTVAGKKRKRQVNMMMVEYVLHYKSLTDYT